MTGYCVAIVLSKVLRENGGRLNLSTTDRFVVATVVPSGDEKPMVVDRCATGRVHAVRSVYRTATVGCAGIGNVVRSSCNGLLDPAIANLHGYGNESKTDVLVPALGDVLRDAATYPESAPGAHPESAPGAHASSGWGYGNRWNRRDGRDDYAAADARSRGLREPQGGRLSRRRSPGLRLFDDAALFALEGRVCDGVPDDSC